MKDYTIQGLANMYWAYASLGHIPSDAHFRALDKELHHRLAKGSENVLPLVCT
jgi:hypothetical protein